MLKQLYTVCLSTFHAFNMAGFVIAVILCEKKMAKITLIFDNKDRVC